jgi:hypothetical protein
MPNFAPMQNIKSWVKHWGSHWLYQKQMQPAAFESMRAQALSSDCSPLSKAAADLFTYHGEDGIIQAILHHIGDVPETFVDIGAGDCIKSNCAALAVHGGWKGLFVDANRSQLKTGERFYKHLKLDGLIFQPTYVRPDNVNEVIRAAGLNGNIGLLSIDVDGNDYWIWEAIEAIQPAVVVIEAKVEFGERNIVVPYAQSNHHSFDAQYNGASVEALRKLGVEKGYILAGANPQGYNLFFVQAHRMKPPLCAAATKELLQHPDTQSSFYPQTFFEQHKFITV